MSPQHLIRSPAIHLLGGLVPGCNEELLLYPLALGDVADHHANDFPIAVKDHVRADFHVDQGAILAAMAPPAAYVPVLLKHAPDVAVRIFPGVGDEVVEREV